MTEVRNKRVTVAGLGHFGGQVAAAKWLVSQGARVLVTDRASREALAESIRQLDGLPIEYRLGEHQTADFRDADLIVASPAIPPSNPFLTAAREAGVPITTEIRLFIERCPATLIGVTGTKGKSTTTALLGAMLSTRFKTFVGGNIGHSLLADLETIERTNLVVLELSSYMLAHLGQMRWSPHVAVVTMIAADHLEWHGSVEAYVEEKSNIVRFQRPDDIAVLNLDDEPTMRLTHLTPARVIGFSASGREPIPLRIPGRHNQANAQAALEAALALGVAAEDARRAASQFAGLSHRLQCVHESGGVRYFNDSIATIPEAAVAALDAFLPRRVIQIIGGSDHGLPITAMCNALLEKAKAVLCIGKAADRVAETLGEGTQSGAAVYRCGDLATAIRVARQIATPGDIILLSPGFKSYDQFANYEQRGSEFARLAMERS